MARPAGHRLSRSAFDDVLRLRGLSITEVAELAELPRATISSLLGGFHRASNPQTHRIALAVGVSPETLFPTLRADLFAAVA